MRLVPTSARVEEDPPGLELRTERLAESTYVVSAAGEIDLCTAPPFDAAVAEALDAGAARLIVDLSGCDFIDSSGLEVLIRAHRRLDDGHQPLTLITQQSCVLLVLEITGLDGVFGVYPSRRAALDARAT
jgi:anti-sigma B factor antagonist